MRLSLITLLLWTALGVSAQPQDHNDLLHLKWDAVIEAIAMVESKRQPNKVSADGQFVGYLQISKILVRECNNIAGYEKYTYNDRYDKQKSIGMFIDFQERHNPGGNMERAIRLWNSGDARCMTRKARTDAYYQRVMRAAEDSRATLPQPATRRPGRNENSAQCAGWRMGSLTARK